MHWSPHKPALGNFGIVKKRKKEKRGRREKEKEEKWAPLDPNSGSATTRVVELNLSSKQPIKLFRLDLSMKMVMIDMKNVCNII